MTNLRIDPDVRDFVLTSGRLDLDAAVTTPLFLCLETQRGTRIGDAEFGSRLHDLEREVNPGRAALRAPAMVEEALQPLVDEGVISEVSTTTEQIEGGIAMYVTVRGPGMPEQTFRIFQKVGP